MQDFVWDDLRYLLALHRTGTLAGAGRQLSVSETTVARRIRAFERALGAGLFLRSDPGRYGPTDVARVLLAHAETVEGEVIALRERLGQMAGRLAGVVRVSSVPVIINRILIPHIGRLAGPHPDLVIELVPQSRNVDLTRREADLAVRFARPARGGLAVKAQKLGSLEFAVFGPATTPAGAEDTLAWIGYDDGGAALPQARWIERLRAGRRPGPVRVADLASAQEAVAQGLGKSLLPIAAGRGDARLRALAMAASQRTLTRDVWLLSHAGDDARPAVAAAKDWLAGLPWA